MGENEQNPQGDTSGGQGASTSQETPTFTQKQVEERERKARSDALADLGRLKKSFDESQKVAEAALKRLKDKEEEDSLREEEANKDNPEELTRIRKRRTDAQRAAQIEERERILTQKEAELQTHSQSIRTFNAERLAEKYNVSAEVLLEYGGEMKDAMEKLAKSYGEKQGSSQTRITSPPDSGKTKGGSSSGRKPTLEELRASTAEETEKKVKSGEWVIPGWTP